MNKAQFFECPWQVEEWTMSGLRAGYRVIRYLSSAQGDYEVARAFAGNIYEAGSFDRARAEAQRLCEELNQPLTFPIGGVTWSN